LRGIRGEPHRGSYEYSFASSSGGDRRLLTFSNTRNVRKGKEGRRRDQRKKKKGVAGSGEPEGNWGEKRNICSGISDPLNFSWLVSAKHVHHRSRRVLKRKRTDVSTEKRRERAARKGWEGTLFVQEGSPRVARAKARSAMVRSPWKQKKGQMHKSGPEERDSRLHGAKGGGLNDGKNAEHPQKNPPATPISKALLLFKEMLQ